jgi:hypothetical protein
MGIIERIRQIKADLINNREAELMRIALDQIALIKLRVQTTGKDFNEQQFEDYTPDYKRARAKAGYQVGFVDFTRTGQFWQGIVPVVVESSLYKTVIELRPSSPRGEAILAGAKKKRGNITQPSKAEIQMARDANRQRILSKFKI